MGANVGKDKVSIAYIKIQPVTPRVIAYQFKYQLHDIASSSLFWALIDIFD